MEEVKMPRLVYEDTMARHERTTKRLIIALVITIALLFASNVIWLCVWNQYDYAEVNVDSQDGGNANYIGASGVINNEFSKSKDKKEKEQEESQRNTSKD